jgi:hypothetical protein
MNGGLFRSLPEQFELLKNLSGSGCLTWMLFAL